MLQQTRQILRSLAKRPLYLIAGVAIVALGVGTTTSMLMIVNALLWRAVPYTDAGRLLSLFENNPAQGIEEMAVSYPAVLRLSAGSPAFDAVAAVHSPQTLIWDAPEGPTRLTASLVAPEIFEITGMTPVIGRVFRADEGVVGAEPVALISSRLWQSDFGGSSQVLGRSLSIEGFAATVVGVVSAGYPDFPDPIQETDIWLPLGMVATTRGEIALQEPRYRIFRVLARTRPDAGDEIVESELARLSNLMSGDYPETNNGWSFSSRSIRDLFLGTYIRPVLALLVGAVLLLVTGWANLGNLVLLRANEQRREVAVRRALGGSGFDIVRHVLTETFLLAGIGGLLGIALALWISRGLMAYLPVDLPAFVDLTPTAGILAAALLTIPLTALALGAAAIVNLRRTADPARTLSAGGKGQSVDHHSGRVMNALIVAEIALAVLLLVGAGLVVRGSGRLAGIDLGFPSDDLWTLQLQLPEDDRTPEEIMVLGREIRDAVAAVVGVSRADLWSPHVPGTATWYTKVRAQHQEALAEDEIPIVRINTVSPGAVSGLGLKIVNGRDLSEDDATSGRRTVLVSASYARETWPGEDAVGQQLRRWSHTEASTVVGVVADAPLSGRRLARTDAFNDVYFLLGQDPQRDWVLLARGADDSAAIVAEIRQALARTAPDLPVFDVQPMARLTAREQAVPRLAALLAAGYAAAAGLLAALGLYAVIAYSVTLQRSAIGLRMALGAQSRRVQHEFTGRGMRLALVGLAIGIAAAAGLSRFLAAQLYGVSPFDVPTFVIVAAGVALVCWLSCLGPARRATRIDPLSALRA